MQTGMQGEAQSYLDKLNDAQRAAVEYDGGPSIVIAGAGSGKTRVLVYKLIHLIHTGYPARGLMALTFTNKAAKEMKERIAEEMGVHVAREIRMGTFHSVFLKLLRDFAPALGYARSFSLYKPSDAKTLIKRIVKDMKLNDGLYKEGLVYNRISLCKNKLISPEMYGFNDDLIGYDASQKMPEIYKIYRSYQHALREQNAMDFDDLLFNTHKLLRDNPDILRTYQDTIDYLLIDEYQDTNTAQFEIVRLLMGARGKIFAVGDDAQSIYAFRGANINNILRFGEAFAGARLFKLEQNYRSSQRIVQAANAIIKKNSNQIPKEVFSREQEGELIKVFAAEDDKEEAEWIAQQIDHVMVEDNASFDDFAILYRTNAQSRVLEEALRRMGMPYVIYGGLAFYDRKEIMDVMAYLRLLVNDQDEGALLRIINYPKRGIGASTVDKIISAARGHGVSAFHVMRSPEDYGVALAKRTLGNVESFVRLIGEMREISQEMDGDDFEDVMRQLIYKTGIPADLREEKTEEAKERFGNVQELLSGVTDFVQSKEGQGEDITLEAYLGEVMLLTDRDQEDSVANQKRVQLMSIHASKGLEFPNVFICGMEEGLFPSERSLERFEIEEERRLFYVALTRAERRCYVSYARMRMMYGHTGYKSPSRFVRELPRDLIIEGERVERISSRSIWGRSQKGSYRGDSLPTSFPPQGDFLGQGRRMPTLMEELGEGLRVRHPKFGEGTIVSLGEITKGEPTASVEFDQGGRKKLSLRFAGLEIID